MGNIKQINVENRTYYFYNDMINIKNLNSGLLKLNKKSNKNIDIYCVAYITIKYIGDYESIHSVNALCLIISKVDGYIEEKNGNKFLVLQIQTKKY